MLRLLIPTDFSDCAKNAVDYALNFFGTTETYEIFLLNTYTLPVGYESMLVTVEDLMEKNTIAALEEEENRIKSVFSSHTIKITKLAKLGYLSSNVELEAKKNKIDYIIMGTQGAHGITDFVLGSNAKNVVESLQIPTIVVPTNAIAPAGKNMLLATDYHILKNNDVLEPVKKLLNHKKASLEILNVTTKNKSDKTEENGHNLDKYFENYVHSLHHVNAKRVEEGIFNFAYDHKSDLIILVKHDYPLVEKIFHESISNKITSHSEIPVLILRG